MVRLGIALGGGCHLVRAPGVADVRLALLVAAAVAERDRLEAVALVELPRPAVDRKQYRSRPSAVASLARSTNRRPRPRPIQSGRTYSCSTIVSDNAISPTTRSAVHGIDRDPGLVAWQRARSRASAGRRRRDGRARSRRSRARTTARRRPEPPRHRRPRGGSSRCSRRDRIRHRAPGQARGGRPRRGSRSRRRAAASWAGQRADVHVAAQDLADDPGLSGAVRRRRGPRARRVTSAGLSVTRATCGSMWVGAGIASAQSAESNAAEPGKTERTCPSPPMPSRMRSRTGQPSASGRSAARRSLSESAAQAAASHACADGLGRPERVEVLGRDRGRRPSSRPPHPPRARPRPG